MNLPASNLTLVRDSAFTPFGYVTSTSETDSMIRSLQLAASFVISKQASPSFGYSPINSTCRANDSGFRACGGKRSAQQPNCVVLCCFIDGLPLGIPGCLTVQSRSSRLSPTRLRLTWLGLSGGFDPIKYPCSTQYDAAAIHHGRDRCRSWCVTLLERQTSMMAGGGKPLIWRQVSGNFFRQMVTGGARDPGRPRPPRRRSCGRNGLIVARSLSVPASNGCEQRFGLLPPHGDISEIDRARRAIDRQLVSLRDVHITETARAPRRVNA